MARLITNSADALRKLSVITTADVDERQYHHVYVPVAGRGLTVVVLQLQGLAIGAVRRPHCRVCARPVIRVSGVDKVDNVALVLAGEGNVRRTLTHRVADSLIHDPKGLDRVHELRYPEQW